MASQTDRASNKDRPIWQDTAEKIALKVSLGVWPIGAVIPGEIDLAKQYGGSRDTVRKALDFLTKRGLFERRPHIGTRVKSRTRSGKFVHEVDDIRGLDRYGNQFPRLIQNVQTITVDASTSEALCVPEGTQMIRFENLRKATEKLSEPVVVTFVYVHKDVLEILDLAKKYSDELIISLVETITGEECVEVKQTFSACEMPGPVAQYFGVAPGTPSLRIIRNYFDEKGKTIVASISWHPPEKYSFSISVKKKLNFRSSGKRHVN